MIEWILSSSILILIVIALRIVFKGKISLRLQYAMWSLVLLRLLLPISFGSADFSVANFANLEKIPPVVTNTVKPNTYVPDNLPAQNPQPGEFPSQEIIQSEPEITETTFDVSAYIPYVVWGLGFVAVTGMFVMTNRRFKRRIGASLYDLDTEKEGLEVWVARQIDTPCLVGVLHPVIYVTESVAKDKTLLRHTLEHEATHYCHRDHIWAVLRCLCLAIHWYNPLVWWAAFLSQRDAELACDEATIKRLGEGERAEYGRTLIGMTCLKKTNVLMTATTMAIGKNGLKERILLIAKKPKMALYTLLIVITVAAVAVGCTFTGATDPFVREDGARRTALTGTKVFASESQMIAVELHPDANIQWLGVPSMDPGELLRWAQGLEYGYALPEGMYMFSPPAEWERVTVYYEDGTKKSSLTRYEMVDGVTYEIISTYAGDPNIREDGARRTALTGTKVFASESEIIDVEIQTRNDRYTLEPSADLSELTQWVRSFTYGSALEEGKFIELGCNVYSVTVHYADGTKQTSYPDYATVDGITYRIIRESQDFPWRYVVVLEGYPHGEFSGTEPSEETQPPQETAVLPEVLQTQPDKDQVCIAVQPTGLVSEGGAFLYIIPENQEVLLEYYTAAEASAHEYTRWDSSNLRSGWWIVYQDQWWQVTESGAMFGMDPETWEGICIDADDAKELYEFCDGEVKQAGIAEPVRPEELTSIKSATLYWNGVHTVTDEYALNKLEKWFTNARESSSTSCWFTAQLVLELENGKTKTITMATDSCAYYMTEGVAYGYGELTLDGINGNEEFYSLFAPAVIYEKSREGMDAVTEYMIYLNWSRYCNQFGWEETIALIDAIEMWAAEEPTYSRFGGAISWTTGLDGFFSDYYGVMLTRLYELAPAEFAWACLGNASEANAKHTLEMFAYQWNMTVEEVRAKLKADIPQN